MAVDTRIEILKFLLLVFNAIFVILGIAIFGCGVWILFDTNNFIVTVSNGESMRVVAGGLFIIGLVVVTVSATGYLGALKEVRFLLLIYMSLLVVIFLGQVFINLVLLLNRNRIITALSEEVDEIIVNYRNETENQWRNKWDLMDTVQQHWQCCGRTNYTQWKTNAYIKTLEDRNIYPCSCFNSSICPRLSNDSRWFGEVLSVSVTIYEQGCQTQMEDWIIQNGLVILAMDLGLVLIQVVQFTLSLYLMWNIVQKNKEKKRAMNDSSALSTPRSSIAEDRPLYH